MSRLRAGEYVAALGSIGLLVVLFLDWFRTEIVTSGATSVTAAWSYASGWGALGWFMDVLLCVAIFGGLSLSYMTVKRTSPAWPVGAAVLTVGIGVAIALALALRLLDLAGDADLGPARVANGLEWPAYVGLAFALLIPVGGFLSLKDERTDSPEARAYTPPPARTAPGT